MCSLHAKELEADGITRLPELVSSQTLKDMQTSFAGRLNALRWNDRDGYERTERFRLMVQADALREYLGEPFELVEAKGWKSLPTKKDFHGWHGDCWYDQEKVKDRIPREVKVAIYLTDVTSGAFQYVKGSHGKIVPRHYKRQEVPDLPLDKMIEMTGPAGSVFMFDTSGIHRQAVPILEPRQAVFLNYHDAGVPLQKEDIDYYRYHPLLLNAAFLGNLSAEDYRILGFGNKSNYIHAFERRSGHRGFQAVMRTAYTTKLHAGELQSRFVGKLKRLLGKS